MAEPAKSFLFGPYELDRDQGVLLRDGKPVPLPPKAMTILGILVENHGKLVEREDLMRRVWPNVFVEDGNLTVIVFALRKILAEGLDGVSPIDTIPKRGYRFVAPVAMNSGGAGPARSGVPADAKAGVEQAARGMIVRPGKVILLRWVEIGLAVVSVILVAGMFLRFNGPLVRSHDPRISLAVLPFENLTGNPANDYLSDSLTAEVIARLTRDYGGSMRVIALDSVLSYKGQKASAPQIASQLRVQYLIQGGVGASGNHIHLSTELIRAASQEKVWGGSYDGDASELQSFEENVAGSVGKELSLQAAGRAREYVPSSPEAYDHYLRGLYNLSLRSRPGFEQALDSFAAATVSDPHYGRAFAQLAVTYNLMGSYSWVNSNYAHNLGKAAAKQAIATDPSLSEAHAALGYSMWFYEWNPAAGEKELLRAVQLDPGNADAHHWYSQTLMTRGRFTEAEQQMHAALALNPRSPILRTNLGWLYYFERRYGLAIEEMKNVVRENPGFVTAHYKLWEAYSVSGDQAGAWKEFRVIAHLLLSPDNEKKVLAIYRLSGYPAALKSFAGISPGEYSGSYVESSRCMIFAGDKIRALDLLQRAHRERDGWMIFVPVDPAFDSLRSDPRFARIRLVAQLPSSPPNQP